MDIAAQSVEGTLHSLYPECKPFHEHKFDNAATAALYWQQEEFRRLSFRMDKCAGFLEFEERKEPKTGDTRLKLVKAMFCKVRYCPICQWRRSMLWKARFYSALPAVIQANPKARFLFLTLTVKNCSIKDLRETLEKMNKAWQKLIKRKEFGTVLGWVRATEVTYSNDKELDAHPHFHILLMVKPSYFDGKNYLSQSRWAEMWQGCLCEDYLPVVDIRTIKERKNKDRSVADLSQAGITETLKYSVKSKDMTENPEWLFELTRQTHKLRFIAAGGLFKDVLKAEKPETNKELIEAGEEEKREELTERIMCFLWNHHKKAYYLKRSVLPGTEEYLKVVANRSAPVLKAETKSPPVSAATALAALGIKKKNVQYTLSPESTPDKRIYTLNEE